MKCVHFTFPKSVGFEKTSIFTVRRSVTTESLSLVVGDVDTWCHGLKRKIHVEILILRCIARCIVPM